jgi:putative endonuclease
MSTFDARPFPHVGSRQIELGHQGEAWAARWYRTHGYTVLACNWTSPPYEIDLVCAKGDLLVIAEVKTRGSSAYGQPFEAVTVGKQRSLRIAAARFLAQPPGGRHRFYADLRFDVVSILGAHLEVIQNAF